MTSRTLLLSGLGAGAFLLLALPCVGYAAAETSAFGAAPNQPSDATPLPEDAGADFAGESHGNPEKGFIDATPADGRKADPSGDSTDEAADGGLLGGLWPVAVVLALIGLLFWAARRYLPGMRRLAGSPAVKVLGRTYLSPKQSVAVLKVGRRLLVVGQAGDRLASLAEIDDPHEVSELIGVCESSGARSATASFRNVFRQADRELDTQDEPAMEVEEGESQEIGRVRNELNDLTRKVREVVDLRK